MAYHGSQLLPRQPVQAGAQSPLATLLPPPLPRNSLPGHATGTSSPGYAAVLITCFVIAWVGVALRFFFRGTKIKSFFRDDWLMLAGALLYTTTCTLRYLALPLDVTKRQDHFPTSSVVRAARYYYVADLACTASIMTVKVSFITFFVRLVVKRWKCSLLRTFMYIIIGFESAYFLSELFQCWPISTIWTKFESPLGKCAPKTFFLVWACVRSIMGAVFDWILGIILPISLLRSVCKTNIARCQLAILVSLGLLAGIASIVPLIYVPALARRIDWYWPSTPLGVWTNLEPGILLLAGGLADFQPMLIDNIEKKEAILSSESSITSVTREATQDTLRNDSVPTMSEKRNPKHSEGRARSRASARKQSGS